MPKYRGTARIVVTASYVCEAVSEEEASAKLGMMEPSDWLSTGEHIDFDMEDLDVEEVKDGK